MKELSFKEIREILPQTHPFLMIDKVIDVKEGKSLTAIKNITADEWSVSGAEYDLEYFPETLIIEAAAQAGSILGYLSQKSSIKKNILLGKIIAEFFDPVSIGEQLIINVKIGKMIATGGFFDCSVEASDKKCAEIKIYYSTGDLGIGRLRD